MSEADKRPNRDLRGARLRLLGLLLSGCSLMTAVSRGAAADPVRAPEAPAPAQSEPTNEPAPLLAYVIGAIGLSGISVGGVTGFLALNQQAIAEDHCSRTVALCDGRGRAANDTGRALRDISTAAWIVGGVGFGLSAYLLLTAPTRKSEVALAVSVDGVSPKAALVAHF